MRTGHPKLTAVVGEGMDRQLDDPEVSAHAVNLLKAFANSIPEVSPGIDPGVDAIKRFRARTVVDKVLWALILEIAGEAPEAKPGDDGSPATVSERPPFRLERGEPRPEAARAILRRARMDALKETAEVRPLRMHID